MTTPAIEPFYKELGRTIQALRARRGITQDDLASRITPRVTRAAIANIEGGKQRVLAHTLWQLAHALGVTPVELGPPPVLRPTPAANRRDVESQLQKELGRGLSKPAIKRLAARIPKAITGRRAEP